jgi:hypothetical protein
VPTVSLVTQQFRGLGQATARGKKLPELPIVVLPHQYDQMAEPEIRADIRARIPDLLSALTSAPSHAPASEAGSTALTP